MSVSNVKWVRLGDYITMRHENNSSLKYGAELIEGVNSSGEFQPTKAGTIDINLKPYKVVRHGDIVYNPSRLNIGSLAYREGEMCIVSHLYQVFYIKKQYEDILSAEYLIMYLQRDEFYRYVDYDNFGSQRAEYNLKKLGELRIPLPSIEVQRELVSVYTGLKSLAEENEALLQPLSDACQAFIVDCKNKYRSVKLGELIKISNTPNNQNCKYPFYGINKDKMFMPTVANTDGLDASKYTILTKDMFVFSGMQTGRDVCIRIGLYNEDSPILVSPAYISFIVKDKSTILPEYLYVSFMRFEMDRYGWFLSDSSVRSNLDWDRFCDIRIPLPPLSVQQKVVDLFNCYAEAKSIAEQAREQLKTICPALVQKAAHTVA